MGMIALVEVIAEFANQFRMLCNLSGQDDTLHRKDNAV